MEQKKVQIIPYLAFCDNCEEAVNTYIHAFGGEILHLSRYSEETCGGYTDRIGKVMHMEFNLGATRMSAGDNFEAGGANTHIKLMIHMDSKEEPSIPSRFWQRAAPSSGPSSPTRSPMTAAVAPAPKTALATPGLSPAPIRASSRAGKKGPAGLCVQLPYQKCKESRREVLSRRDSSYHFPYCPALHTVPRDESICTVTPFLRIWVAPTAPTITGMSRAMPATAAWEFAPSCSVTMPEALRNSSI